MANVKFHDSTFYVPSNKFLVAMKDCCEVHKDSSQESKVTGTVKEGQVFSVSSDVNGMFRIKLGWVNKEACEILVAASNEVKDLSEAFVVKVINNIPVFTEPSTSSHATAVLRIGDLPRVVGESEDFYKLEHGGYIEKRGCRRY